MSPVSLADLVAFIASATAVLFLLRGWRKTPFPRDIRLLVLCLLTLTLGRDLSNMLEWSGLTAGLDVFEDYVEVTVPLLWGFLFYAFFQEIASAELRRREEQLHLMTTQIPGVFWTTDTRLRFTSGLGQGLSSLALKPNELVGRTLQEYFETEDTDFPPLAAHRRALQGESVKYEFTFKGTAFDTHVEPLRDHRGNVVGVVGIALNLTERKQAEMALSQSEERYRSLVENALDGYFIAELPEGHFVFINKKAGDIFGYTQQEAMKLTIWDTISPEDHDTMRERIKRRFDGEQLDPPFQVYKAIRKDGSSFLAEVSGAKVFFQGKPVIQGLIRDITEQRRLQEQFQQAQKMEAVGTLAGGIAHDFNNLLMAVQGSVSLMLFELDPGHPFYERLKGIEKQVQSGARLTSQLLGYARKGRYEVRPVDLNNLARQTAEAFGRARKEITVEMDMAPDLLPVDADENQIEQVLLNLFVNAADAMARKGGTLVLRTENVTGDVLNDKPYQVRAGQYVLLTVTDTGVGMTKETMDRIFEPFFTTKEMGRGTGLGLASAYGIVKGHGGYIDVDSQVGRGTTFKVYLPSSKRRPTDVITPAPQIVPGQGTVLLIDDEEIILEVGAAMVKALGYEVLAAKSGEEALRCYRENRGRIDLVILDMVMPEMGGGELFDRIREYDPHVKVLLSSGYSIDGEASEILSRGCDGFIQKPFDMNQISRSIEDLLKKDKG